MKTVPKGGSHANTRESPFLLTTHTFHAVEGPVARGCSFLSWMRTQTGSAGKEWGSSWSSFRLCYPARSLSSDWTDRNTSSRVRPQKPCRRKDRAFSHPRTGRLLTQMTMHRPGLRQFGVSLTAMRAAILAALMLASACTTGVETPTPVLVWAPTPSPTSVSLPLTATPGSLVAASPTGTPGATFVSPTQTPAPPPPTTPAPRPPASTPSPVPGGRPVEFVKSLTAPLVFPNGGGPDGIAMGDFDGDGRDGPGGHANH